MASKHTILPDTNFFLHCLPPDQVPWGDVSGSDEVCVLVPQEVLREIDRLKHDGNGRRAKRARIANSLFRSIVHSTEETVVVRESAPRVLLGFAPALGEDAQLPQSLDLSVSDDRIVAEAFRYTTGGGSTKVAILTNDTGLMLAAKRSGVGFIETPPAWMLPAEPDPRDKRIKELEAKVAVLQHQHPLIQVELTDSSGEVLPRIVWSLSRYSPLTEVELHDLMDSVQRHHPMQRDFDRTDTPKRTRHESALDAAMRTLGGRTVYVHPSDEQIREYQEELYPGWLTQVESALRSLHWVLWEKENHKQLWVRITNEGSVPAENTTVEFQALGGIALAPPSDSGEEVVQEEIAWRLPPCPAPPEGRWTRKKSSAELLVESLQRSHGLTGWSGRDYVGLTRPELFGGHQRRDRHAFYWRTKRPVENELGRSFECDEFRHKDIPEEFELVVVAPEEQDSGAAALECKVHARNLPEPCRAVFPILLEYAYGSTLSYAQKAISLL